VAQRERDRYSYQRDQMDAATSSGRSEGLAARSSSAYAQRDYALQHQPGEVVSSVPTDASTVAVGGIDYRYYGGTFHRAAGDGYVVVNPPIGAAVRNPPADASRVYVGTRPYHYYYGTYYAYDPGMEAYDVVEAPSGAMVSYLPEDCLSIYVEEKLQYVCDNVLYRPIMAYGQLRYEVIEG